MLIRDLLDYIKLPFRKDKELYFSIQRIVGFYPHRIDYFKQALMHKSIGKRNAKGRPVNNERLEFLGDAILDAVVGDIVYRHFEGKREGFLTNTRSKIVQRETLNRLAREMGVNELIVSSGHYPDVFLNASCITDSILNIQISHLIPSVESSRNVPLELQDSMLCTPLLHGRQATRSRS